MQVLRTGSVRLVASLVNTWRGLGCRWARKDSDRYRQRFSARQADKSEPGRARQNVRRMRFYFRVSPRTKPPYVQTAGLARWTFPVHPVLQSCVNRGPARGKIREYPSLTSINVPAPETLNNIDWITRVPHSLKRHFPPRTQKQTCSTRHALECR